ncbi:MAG: hypothetical protein K940chlam8_00585 [Chlamydiae bacterium]|nr:hypothetical protein [Chlamydiota bacterium]
MYYVFVSSSLPRLNIHQEPSIAFEELMDLIELNFSRNDKKIIWQIRELFDLFNLQRQLYGYTISNFGNYNKKQLQDLLHLESLPSYIFDFFSDYQNPEEQKKHFPELLARFYREKLEGNGFLKKFYHLLRTFTLMQVAFRCKKIQRNVDRELEFEDTKDEIVHHILTQRDVAEFQPVDGFEKLKPIFDTYFEDPKKLYFETIKFLFNKLEAQKSVFLGKEYFFIYFAQFILLEKLYRSYVQEEFLKMLF